jgi:hypothetical protein
LQPLDTTRHFLTFFDDQYAAKKGEAEWTLLELADEIRITTEASKAQLPWVKMARFGETKSKHGCLRTNANTLEVSGVEIDYDAGTVTFEAALAALRQAKVRALLYTSPSYVVGSKEKWRILAPLSKLRPPRERAEYVATLNGVIDGVAARESFPISTAFYYGSVNGNRHHRVEVVDGHFIDTRPELWAARIHPVRTKAPRRVRGVDVPGAAPGYDEDELLALLEQSRLIGPDGKGQWHNSMLAATASMVGKGWTDEDIAEACAPYADGGAYDADIAVLIRTARERFGIPNVDQVAVVAPALAQLAAAAGIAMPIREPDWRERYVNLRPKASLHNARLAIEALKVHCSWDTFHNVTWMGRSPAAAPSEPLLSFFGRVTDTSIGSLRVYLSNTFGLDFTEKHVRDAVNML